MILATKKFINETGGEIHIPVVAEKSPLVGAIDHWTIVENGKSFSVDVENGVPTNPSLRVLAAAKKYGIRPA